MTHPTTLAIDEIVPAEDNLRREMTTDKEMLASIESLGIIEPLVVTPRTIDDGANLQHVYLLVAGHRRLHHARLAGLTEVPVHVVEYDEEQRVLAMIVENLKRVDLDPIEEAGGYFRLIEAGMKKKDLAAAVGRTVAHVTGRMALLQLDPMVQQYVRSGWLTFELAERIAKLGQRAVDELFPWVNPTEEWLAHNGDFDPKYVDSQDMPGDYHVADLEKRIKREAALAKLTKEAEKMGLTVAERPAWQDFDTDTYRLESERVGSLAAVTPGATIDLRPIWNGEIEIVQWELKKRTKKEREELAAQKVEREARQAQYATQADPAETKRIKRARIEALTPLATAKIPAAAFKTLLVETVIGDKLRLERGTAVQAFLGIAHEKGVEKVDEIKAWMGDDPKRRERVALALLLAADAEPPGTWRSTPEALNAYYAATGFAFPADDDGVVHEGVFTPEEQATADLDNFGEEPTDEQLRAMAEHEAQRAHDEGRTEDEDAWVAQLEAIDSVDDIVDDEAEPVGSIEDLAALVDGE